MRAVIASLMLSAMLFTMAPVAHAAEIGAVLPGRALAFWRAMTSGMTAAAKDLQVDLVVRSPVDSAALDEQKNIQLQMIDFMVRRRVAALVLCPEPLDGVAGPVPIAVPTVFVDRPSTDYTALAAVTSDNYAIGRKAALILAPMLRKGARVVMLRVAANLPSTSAREEGFLSVAREKGWTIVADPYVGHKLREAEVLTAKVLEERQGHLDAVFAPNESVAYGAVRTVAAMPAESRPRLVAVDWRPEFRAAMENGTLTAAVLQNPYRMGYRAVVAAVAVSQGQSPAAHEIIEATVLTRETMNDPAVLAVAAAYTD
jgi:ribose transport system substrate-binding protein